MSLKNVDMEAGIRRIAERRIEEAMREGKFDNLAGKGKPLDLEPLPADENARLAYWAIRIMKQNDFTPDEVRWRKAIDHLRDALARAADEASVRQTVERINDLIHKVNTMGTNVLKDPLVKLSTDDAVERFRARGSGNA